MQARPHNEDGDDPPGSKATLSDLVIFGLGEIGKKVKWMVVIKMIHVERARECNQLSQNLFPEKKKLTSGPSREPVITTPPAPSPVHDSPDQYMSSPPPSSSADRPRHFHGESSEPAAGTPSDGRMFIVPDGDTFHPAQQPTHQIRDIIRGNFNEPYLSWQTVPPAVKDMWFREFASCFSWLPEDEAAIRRNFNRKTSARFRDMFTDIRRSENKPLWIRESVWNELRTMWNTPEYKKKREQNKANRGSESGDEPLNTGGSIPNTQHFRRLKEVLGRDPTTVELHIRTHRRKETEEWVTTKSKNVHDEYMRLKELSSQTCTAEAGAGGSTAPTDFDLWNKAVGGKKKAEYMGWTPKDMHMTSHIELLLQEPLCMML